MTRAPRSILDGLQASGRLLGVWGWAAVVCSVATAWPVMTGAVGVARAMLAVSTPDAAHSSEETALAETYRGSFTQHVAQIEGRSMFFVPRPPPPPAARVETLEEPPPPSRYGGPAVIAMINGSVWFEGGEQMSLDEAARSGVRVVSLNPPWSARIEWNGKEWDVPLFDRTTGRFLEAPAPADAHPAAPVTPIEERH